MLDRSKWNPKVTEEAIIGADARRNSSLDDPGFCLACGLEHGGIDPDARRMKCEACGEKQVYGIFELLMEIA